MSSRRAWVLPVLVIEPCTREAPEEYSVGTRPTNEPMVLPVNRCQSPISMARANDVNVDTPRRQLNRRTTGVNSLSAAIAVIAADSEFTPVVRRLSCLRGVSTLTSFALAIEIGDWHRFTGNTIGSFVGLVPTEYSSGASRVQGSITKTGNTHARRLLIEAAWHHRARYRAGATMLARWDLASPAARARGDDGNRRLHARWARFDERHKRAVIANVAVARELAGWCWSLAVLQENTAMAH